MSYTSQVIEKCQKCGQVLIGGTRFCVHCGSRHEAEKLATTTQPAGCPKCARYSDYNSGFCTSCGFSLLSSTPLESVPKRTTLRWEVPSSASPAPPASASPPPVSPITIRHEEGSRQPDSVPPAITSEVKPAKTQASSKLRKSQAPPLSPEVIGEVFSALLGTIIGIAIFAGANNAFIKPALERQSSASSSLVVYAKPAGATVKVEEAQKRVAAAGAIPPDGKLAFSELPEGQYGVLVEKPGYKSMYGSVTIQKGRATLLGHPQPIELTEKR